MNAMKNYKKKVGELFCDMAETKEEFAKLATELKEKKP